MVVEGVHSQDAYGLEASEGSLCDVADGVVPQTEGLEIPQYSQTAFIQTGQVVVGQVPKETQRGGQTEKRTEEQRETEREREREAGKKE